MHISLHFSNFEFFAPVKPITFICLLLAVKAASIIFLLLPLVDIAKSKSALFPIPSICLEKTLL